MSDLAAPINLIVDDIVKALLTHDDDLVEVVKDVFPTERISNGNPRMLDRYPTDRELRSSLEHGAADLRECALQLLVRIDPAAALRFACAIKDTTRSLGGWNVRDPLAAALDNRAELTLNECAHLLPIDDLVTRLRRGQFSWQPAMREHVGLSTPEGRFRALEQALAPGREIGLARDLVAFLIPLVVSDDLPGVEALLAPVWLDHTHRFQADAGHALHLRNRPSSYAILAQWLDRLLTDTTLPPPPAFEVSDPFGVTRNTHLAMSAMFDASPTRELDHLGRFFDATSLDLPYGRYIAYIAMRELITRLVASKAADDRWPALLVSLLGRPILADSARLALTRFPKKIVVDALAAAGVSLTYKAPRSPIAPPAPRWQTRYLAGETDAVWREIWRSEGTIRDPLLLSEVEAVATETMERFRSCVEAIVISLKRAGVDLPPPSRVLGRPAANTSAQIAKLEKAAGTLPVSLKAFYAVVVSVNLVPPAIAVAPGAPALAAQPSIVLSNAVSVLGGVQREKQINRAVMAPLRTRLHAWVAPTPGTRALFHEDQSPYRLALPDEGGDGRVVQTLPGHEVDMYFVEYLRALVRQPGFPPVKSPFLRRSLPAHVRAICGRHSAAAFARFTFDSAAAKLVIS